MDFEQRQAGYYFNAGRYLFVFEKFSEDKKVLIRLTGLGRKVFKLNYKERQLKLVSLILEHRIFSELFDSIIATGTMPTKTDIAEKMRLFEVCKECLIERRSSSVYGWLK